MSQNFKNIERTTGTSAANTDHTVSTPTGSTRRFLYATVAYSADPTQDGTSAMLDSGAGSSHDVILATGDEDARYTFMLSPSDCFYILKDDAIAVTAPAGGSGITSSIVIYTEILD